MGRVFFYGLVLVAAAGLPYLSSTWSNSSQPPNTENTAGAAATAASTPANSSPAATTVTPPPPAALLAPQPGEPPFVDLTEAMRFDVTTPWLFGRWPRVTAGLPEGHLQGYRVPLVTGTSEQDIAGALTYYFNPGQRCEKITFQGSVGDPRKIVQYLVSTFDLQPYLSPNPGEHLYQTRWNGQAVSYLRIKPVAVVKANSPHTRYDVQMVLSNFGARN